MKLELIYQGAANLIHQLIRKEHTAQGHHLTGNFENSLEARVGKTILTGHGASYGMLVNEGVESSKISFKMLPGLIRYFLLRGFPENEAKRIARATVLKQMQEGMSTQASKRFSTTGARHHFVEAAFLDPAIDQYMTSSFDFAVNEEYSKTKSETI